MRTAFLSIVCFFLGFQPNVAFAQWTGGPVIISGLDPEVHDLLGGLAGGGVDPDHKDNWLGRLYVQQGFDFIRAHLDLDALCGREKVVCLGCNGDQAEEVFNVAFDASFLNTQLGWQRVTINGDTGIDSIPHFFAGTHNTINLQDAAVIYLPSIETVLGLDGNSGISEAELAVLDTNKVLIESFVTSTKGGLFSHTHIDESILAFDWLTGSGGLLPNVTTADEDSSAIDLTPAGLNALPALAKLALIEGDVAHLITGILPVHARFDNVAQTSFSVLVEEQAPSPAAIVIAAPAPLAPCNTNTIFPDFADADVYAVGSAPQSVVIADFDAVNGPDIAVANAGDSFDPGTTVSVLLNTTGAGLFAAAVDYTVGTMPVSIVAADFDGDTDVDLAVANSVSFDITVLLNDGLNAGTFNTTSVTFSDPQFQILTSLTAADFDEDGDIDISVTEEFLDKIFLFLNNGASPPAFLLDSSPATGNEPRFITVDDFIPGDGPDLVVANYNDSNSKDVTVLKNNVGTSSPIFADDFPTNSFTSMTGIRALTSADFDANGGIDLATIRFYNDSPITSNLRINLNDATGLFGPPIRYGPDDAIFGVDIDPFFWGQDAYPDLVVAESTVTRSFFSVFQNERDGTFRHTGIEEIGTASNSFAFASSMAVDDLDGDGRTDLVIADSLLNQVAVILQASQTISQDCNNNGLPDECDISDGISSDCNDNDIPDECDPDDIDGDGEVGFDDNCPCDYNPPNTAPKDCNADGDGGQGR